MQPPREADDWYAWLAEAEAIVRRWETAHSARMLSTAEAVQLTASVAQALQRAFEHGRTDTRHT